MFHIYFIRLLPFHEVFHLTACPKFVAGEFPVRITTHLLRCLCVALKWHFTGHIIEIP